MHSVDTVDTVDCKDTPLSCLARFETGRGTTAEIWVLFDSLPPVSLDAMRGRWRGTGLPSGHPMDGLLERFGWYGKDFNGADDVQPLLCKTGRGEVFALNPALVPMSIVNRHIRLFHSGFAGALFALLGRAAATSSPTARLRMMEYRDVTTATMIYDSLPIFDMFRTVDADTLLGVMDLRGAEQPFFFVLRRESRP
jgi:hypothetical protein